MNVSVDLSTVASPVSLADRSITTFPEGWESKTTVKVPVVPASETVAVLEESVKPEVSSSVVVTVICESARGSKLLSAVEPSLTVIVTVEF